MADFKLGTSAVLAIYRGDQLLWRWSMPNLFLGGKAGHAADGYAQSFAPEHLFATTSAGFCAGGYGAAP